MSAFSANDFDYRLPTGFGAGYDQENDSFASLTSFLNDRSADSVQLRQSTEDSSGGSNQPSPDDDMPGAASTDAAAHSKRKTAAEASKQTAALKDRKSGNAHADVHHTHGSDGESTAAGKAGKKKSTSDKRKEQNRNAQRAFRERREKYARELEDKLAAMTEVAETHKSENTALKELIAQLQNENARTNPPQSSSSSSTSAIPALANSAFTFNMRQGSGSSGQADSEQSPASSASVETPASAHSGRSNSFPPPTVAADGLPDFTSLFALPSPKSFDAVAQQSYGTLADPMLSAYQPDLFATSAAAASQSGTFAPLSQPGSRAVSDQNLFGPGSGKMQEKPLSPAMSFTVNSPASADLFTPGGEHFNPFSSLDDILGATSTSSLWAPGAVSASYDAPTPSSDLFASYREPSASFITEPTKTNVASPSPAFTGAAEEPSSSYGQWQDSGSSGASIKSYDSRSTPAGDSSSASSPPSARPDKPSPSGSWCNATCHNGDIMRDQFNSLRGSEAFDLDALCSDMTKKATCKDAMKHALDRAVQEDLDVMAVFQSMGADKSTREAYRRTTS